MATKPRPSTRPSPTASSSSGNRTTWIVVGLVAVVVIAALVAIVPQLFGDDDGGSPGGGETTSQEAGSELTTGTVVVQGAPLPRVTEADVPDPAVGQPMPTITGQSIFDGSQLTVGGDASPMVVIFLAHWCPHCQAEVPRVQEWLGENDLQGVELFAVSTAVDPSRGNYPPAEWLSEEGWTVPTIADSSDNSALSAVGGTGFPYFVAVDDRGNVVERTSGELSTEQFSQLLEAARTSEA